MLLLKKLREQSVIAKELLYWTIIVTPISIFTGAVVALFLWLLDLASVTRWENLWIILFLPFVGIGIYFLYKLAGKNAEAGNNLIMDEIHKPGAGVPARMTPLILITTIVTHLFGGSAGREGTAVQMGGSIASMFSRWFKLSHDKKRILLMAGIAAGFGAVFGTPVTGAIFAMEVIAIGRIRFDALWPCLFASIIAHATCTTLGVPHTHYEIQFGTDEPFLSNLPASTLLLLQVILGGVAFGLAGFLFAETTHAIKHWSQRTIKIKWLIPAVGGVLVLMITYAIQSYDYLGLGVVNPVGGVSIVSSFNEGGATHWSWIVKLLLTAITLGMGFKGGEVTPLFFIGATLGYSLAMAFGAPVDLFAGLGFIAVFAAATNTPIACTMMGIELFGAHHVLHYAIACFIAYYFSGHTGIYASQRIATNKFHRTEKEDRSLQEHRADHENHHNKRGH